MVMSWKITATMMMVMVCACTSDQSACPTSCSFLSPIPYPFGAADGCGAPGFQISNCSRSPQWDLRLGDTMHVYYIQSIGAIPNSSNRSSLINYGYGGFVLLSLPTPTTPHCDETDPLSPLIMSSFSSSNMYAFQGATLSFYEQHYLLLNCTGSGLSVEAPSSGTFVPSGSQPCLNYLKHCNISTTVGCLDYAPDKELYLPNLITTYKCSSFRRFVIAHDNDPVDSWIIATQFAWAPLKDADSCSGCQKTGGTCGYNTQDNTFLCFCGNETYQKNCDRKQWGGRVGLLVGIPLAVAFLMALALITYYCHQNPYHWRSLGNQKRLRLDEVNQAPIEFPYGALAAATKSFRSEIGCGAFGKVYKGQLPDGNEVAVKVLDASISHSDEMFLNEVATIGNIHHMNVARLFGFCFQRSRKILVYEYVCNGSLDKYLFPDKKQSSSVVLSWKQRFDIALGIARGLSYMHEECREFIIHCDIKPQNILLDASYCPKISDFGLAKLLTREESRILTQARGTPGYVAPEFWSLGSGPLTSKFDVYSYGMVLLEIVRGQRSFHMFDPFSIQASDEHLSKWSSVFVDKRIVQDADLKQARVCTLVALWCVQEDPSFRPTMGRVVQYLQGTAPVPNPPLPFRKIGKHEGSSLSKEEDVSFPLSKESQQFPHLALSRD